MKKFRTSKGDYVALDSNLRVPIGYTFLCTTDDISEEVADSIVDKVGNGHYQDYYGLADYCVFALRSFKSLLQKLNLSPDKNYAICKKN